MYAFRGIVKTEKRWRTFYGIIKKLKPCIGADFKNIPTTKLLKKQMTGFGGMISFELKIIAWKRLLKYYPLLKIFSLAESLGGVESLLSHLLL